MVAIERDHNAARIENLLNPSLDAEGFHLVQARFIGGQNRPTLQLMVERADGGRVNIDECAKLSRACSAIIDVEDAIAGAYVLEVSSPGIDRPLMRLADFEKNIGRNVKIEMQHPVNGRKRFYGKMMGVNGASVILSQDGSDTELAIADMVAARLAISDTVLAPTPKKIIHKNGHK